MLTIASLTSARKIKNTAFHLEKGFMGSISQEYFPSITTWNIYLQTATKESDELKYDHIGHITILPKVGTSS